MVKEFGVDFFYSKEAKTNREHKAQLDAARKKLKIDKKTELLNGEDLVATLEDLIKKVNSPDNKEGDADNIPDKVMVIVLDMNGLKFLNDNYGHSAGDGAIIAFANRLRAVFRDVDFIFRTNNAGDEFAVLLQIFNNNVDTDKIFERVKAQVNVDLFINIEGVDFPITGAMGYTVLDKGEKRSSLDLIKEADKRMYEDKKKSNNNNQTHFFDADPNLFSRN